MEIIIATGERLDETKEYLEQNYQGYKIIDLHTQITEESTILDIIDAVHKSTIEYNLCIRDAVQAKENVVIVGAWLQDLINSHHILQRDHEQKKSFITLSNAINHFHSYCIMPHKVLYLENKAFPLSKTKKLSYDIYLGNCKTNGIETDTIKY